MAQFQERQALYRRLAAFVSFLNRYRLAVFMLSTLSTK